MSIGNKLMKNAYQEMIMTLGDAQNVQLSAIDQATSIYDEAIKANISRLEQSMTSARADIAPYVEAGRQGQEQLQILFGMKGEAAQAQYMQQIMSSPYVTAQVKMATENAQNSAAAKGKLHSGQTLEELTSLGLDISTREIKSIQDGLLQMAQQGLGAATAQATITTEGNRDIVGQNLAGADAASTFALQKGQVRAQTMLAQEEMEFQAKQSGIDIYGTMGRKNPFRQALLGAGMSVAQAALM